MSYILMVTLSYSIIPAVLFGVYKFRTIDRIYFPILVCIIFGFINEVTSTILISKGYSNAVNNNIYYLAETLLLLLQFKKWQLFDEYPSLFSTSVILTILVWLIENRSWHYINLFLPHFRSIGSMLVVVMSILTINKLIINHTEPLLRCPIFLFCTGFCLYFSTCLVVEVFLYYGSQTSILLRDAVFKAGSIINAVTNLIYLIAILWMPQKPRFIMQ